MGSPLANASATWSGSPSDSAYSASVAASKVATSPAVAGDAAATISAIAARSSRSSDTTVASGIRDRSSATARAETGRSSRATPAAREAAGQPASGRGRSRFERRIRRQVEVVDPDHAGDGPVGSAATARTIASRRRTRAPGLSATAGAATRIAGGTSTSRPISSRTVSSSVPSRCSPSGSATPARRSSAMGPYAIARSPGYPGWQGPSRLLGGRGRSGPRRDASCRSRPRPRRSRGGHQSSTPATPRSASPAHPSGRQVGSSGLGAARHRVSRWQARPPAMAVWSSSRRCRSRRPAQGCRLGSRRTARTSRAKAGHRARDRTRQRASGTARWLRPDPRSGRGPR